MSKVIGLFLALLLVSCANSNKEPVFDSNAVSEKEAFDYMVEPESVTLDTLVSEKLISYFELLKLKMKYPEFEEDIRMQLKDISKEEFAEPNYQDDFSIENIHMASELSLLSDSVQHTRLYYDMVSKNLRKTDSVNALIATKTILLDGVPMKSTKITFSKID